MYARLKIDSNSKHPSYSLEQRVECVEESNCNLCKRLQIPNKSANEAAFGQDDFLYRSLRA